MNRRSLLYDKLRPLGAIKQEQAFVASLPIGVTGPLPTITELS